MMDKELKKKWIDALRSGKYIQGKNRLHTSCPEESFCCLGVLCEIVGVPKAKTSMFAYAFEDVGFATMLPSKFLAHVGFTEDIAEELAEANDSGKTFLDIADMIETDKDI